MLLSNQKISLRAPEPKDLDVLDRWENDQRLWHLSNTSAPISRYLLKQYIKSAQQDIYAAKQLRLMIDLKLEADELTIGAIDLFDFDPLNHKAGIGILIDEKYRMQGLAAMALKLVIDYGFNVLGLHQYYCNILTGNHASLKLFEAEGFRISGKKLEWVKVNGQWQDEYLLQLLRTEYKTIS